MNRKINHLKVVYIHSVGHFTFGDKIAHPSAKAIKHDMKCYTVEVWSQFASSFQLKSKKVVICQ